MAPKLPISRNQKYSFLIGTRKCLIMARITKNTERSQTFFQNRAVTIIAIRIKIIAIIIFLKFINKFYQSSSSSWTPPKNFAPRTGLPSTSSGLTSHPTRISANSVQVLTPSLPSTNICFFPLLHPFNCFSRFAAPYLVPYFSQ